MAKPLREKPSKDVNPTNPDRELSAVGKYRLTKMKQRQLMRYFSLQHPESHTPNTGSCSSSSASSSVCDSQEKLSFDKGDISDDISQTSTERENKQSSERKTKLLAEGKALIKSRRKDLNRLKSDSDVITHKHRKAVCEDMVRSLPYMMTADNQKVDASQIELATKQEPPRRVMQHPTKKMLRTRSESAIELNMARNRLSNQPGVVCSNEDLKKILTEARKAGSVRRRPNSGHSALSVMPESPIEGHMRSKSMSMASSLKGRRSPDIIYEYRQGCRSSPESFESFNLLNTSFSSTNSVKEIGSIEEIDEDMPSCSRDIVDDNKNTLKSDAKMESELADTLSSLSIDIDSAIDPEAIGKAIERRLARGNKQGNKTKKGSLQTNINFQKNQLSNKSKEVPTQGSEKGFANRITSLTSKFKRSKSTTDCVKL